MNWTRTSPDTRDTLLWAVGAAALVALVGVFGVASLGAIVAAAALIGFIRAPGMTSLMLWSVIALIPEWRSDISVAPGLSTAMYRSLVGAVSGADFLVVAAVVTAVVANPQGLRSLWTRHRTLALAYGLFLGSAAVSMAWRGQIAHPIPLKPLLYLPLAVLWGYAMATDDVTATWVPYLVVGLAAIVGVQGLLNALVGLGREAAGFHLAFYDRASVFLLIVIVLFVAQARLAQSPLTRGARFLVWGAVTTVFVLATALSLRRTMWVTLAVGGLVTVGLHAHRGVARLLARTLGVFAVALGAGLALLGVMGYLGNLITHTQSLLLTLGGHGEEASITTRLFETQDVVRTIRAHPIIGAGPLGQYVASSAYAPALDRTYVHDQYLWLLLHYGVVGLATFLFFWYKTIRTLLAGYRNVEPADAHGLARLALGAGLVGLAFGIFGDSFITAHHRWPLLLGFMLGASLGTSAPPRQPDRSGPPGTGR